MQRGPGQHFHHHQLLAGPTLAVAACPVLAGHACLCPPGSPCHPSARGSPPVPSAPEGAAAPRAWPQGAGPAQHLLLAPGVSLPCLLLLPAGSPPTSARGRMRPPACQPPGEASSGSCHSRAGTEQPRAELSPVNEHGGSGARALRWAWPRLPAVPRGQQVEKALGWNRRRQEKAAPVLLEPGSGRLSKPTAWLGCEPPGTCTGWAPAPALAGSRVLPQVGAVGLSRLCPMCPVRLLCCQHPPRGAGSPWHPLRLAGDGPSWDRAAGC